jgi:hypothetical protein
MQKLLCMLGVGMWQRQAGALTAAAAGAIRATAGEGIARSSWVLAQTDKLT